MVTQVLLSKKLTFLRFVNKETASLFTASSSPDLERALLYYSHFRFTSALATNYLYILSKVKKLVNLFRLVCKKLQRAELGQIN